MADLVQPTPAAMRTADALLRFAGGRSVLLRTPSPAIPGDPSEQLGLATPSFQDIELAPAVLRGQMLLLSASAVETIMGTLASNSANVLFADAFGVLIDGALYEIESVETSQTFGIPYLYRLTLRAPAAQTL
ncbi:MAG TPA: hypothetical protein VGC07_06665 [Granulicella sp.]